jgi:hypothetical protein
MRNSIASLGPLNLFAMASGKWYLGIAFGIQQPHWQITAIHSQIFQYRNSVNMCQSLTSIRHTLANWHTTWQLFDSASSSSTSPHILVDEGDIQPESMWKRNGFYRYCAEYWLLANLMADRLALAELLPRNSISLLNDSVLDPILSKYDQTSMRQVNDLITGFQTFQIWMLNRKLIGMKYASTFFSNTCVHSSSTIKTLGIPNPSKFEASTLNIDYPQPCWLKFIAAISIRHVSRCNPWISLSTFPPPPPRPTSPPTALDTIPHVPTCFPTTPGFGFEGTCVLSQLKLIKAV